MIVLPVAALGPVFGPSHGAFTATEAATALLALASAAVHTDAALAEDERPIVVPATRATTADAAAMRFEILINVVPFLASWVEGYCWLFGFVASMLLREASAPDFKRRLAE